MKQSTATPRIGGFLMLIGLLLATVPIASAQDTSAQTTTNPPTPKVTDVKNQDAKGELELGQDIRIAIAHLSEWAANAKHDPHKLVPSLNGRALSGLYPVEVHTSQNHLHFHLQITPENKEVWADLLRKPKVRRPVTVSVGLEDQTPFDTVFDRNNRLPLIVIPPVWGTISLVVIVLTLILLLWLARITDLIRDPGSPPGLGQSKPYNLGRMQMAFWFFLIYISYMGIWLITDNLDTITPSLLALMGISAGTALSDAVIDSSKLTAKTSQLDALTAEKQTLEQRIAEINPQLANSEAKATANPPTATQTELTTRDEVNKELQEKRARLNEVNQTIKTLAPATKRSTSVHFFQDILSDADGYSFHRFQIFAWTIVLGIIFIASVYNTLAMPEFSATLLGLMGISAGTYIGFKFPEQPK